MNEEFDEVEQLPRFTGVCDCGQPLPPLTLWHGHQFEHVECRCGRFWVDDEDRINMWPSRGGDPEDWCCPRWDQVDAISWYDATSDGPQPSAALMAWAREGEA